ncbi:protein kinase [Streptomyces sp. NPDC005898]|uniref:protein kinase domain-containing protein n=1 Tax=Streptomyces sp. NPDC005898 TaxID=3157082 RepID=UPI00340BAABC
MRGRLLNGRYELLAPIGAGGMGQVWRARDRSLNREVAVKLLVPSASADAGERAQLLARFRQEARAAAALDSPYIVAVHDHGADGDGTPYLVMALVQGRSLDQILRERVRVPVAEALRWAADVCRALDVAHTAGVVHRDIKPGNVMVARDGTAKVVDFGIATFVERAAGDSRLTHTGQLPFGSVPYLAPERFRQEAGDGRTDLYALGCVLYELLVGGPPFTGTAAGVMYQHVNDAPPRPSAARPEVTRPVERLVLDLLAKDPDDRPADAATTLDRILAAARSLPPDAEAASEKAPARESGPEGAGSPAHADAAPSGLVPFDEASSSPADARPPTSDAAEGGPSAPWDSVPTSSSPRTPTVRVQDPGPRPAAPPSLATAHTRPALPRAQRSASLGKTSTPLGQTTVPLAPGPGRRSRRRLLLTSALILAVGIPVGFGVQALTASDAGSTPGTPSGADGKETVLEIGVAHSYRHVGNPRGTDAGPDPDPDSYEKAELDAFRTQQLRTVKSALTETLGAEEAARFRVVPVTADPDTTARELLAGHPGMLAVVGDTADFAWVHDTDEAFLPEISTCAEYAHADGAFAIPADEARQGEAMARYLRAETTARRVLVAQDELWADREDGIGTALRRGGLTMKALDVEPGKVKAARIPAVVAAARADAVVVPTGTRADVWAKALRADGFKGPVLTQADPEGTCADSEDRARAEARDKDVPAGVLRTRNYTGEPDDNLPARGNQELYDGATALAAALEKLPPADTSATSAVSLRHTLDREIQRVSVNGVLDDVSFEKRRSARQRPVWFDRREGAEWAELGKVDAGFEPTRR